MVATFYDPCSSFQMCRTLKLTQSLKVYSLKNLLKERKPILQHVIMSLHQWKCLHVLVKHRAGSHPDLLRWSADLCWAFVTDAVFLSRFFFKNHRVDTVPFQSASILFVIVPQPHLIIPLFYEPVSQLTLWLLLLQAKKALLLCRHMVSSLMPGSDFQPTHFGACACAAHHPHPPTHPRAGNKQSFPPTSVNKNVVSATLSGGWMRVDGAQKCRRSKRKRDRAFETFPSQNTSKYIYEGFCNSTRCVSRTLSCSAAPLASFSTWTTIMVSVQTAPCTFTGVSPVRGPSSCKISVSIYPRLDISFFLVWHTQRPFCMQVLKLRTARKSVAKRVTD